MSCSARDAALSILHLLFAGVAGAGGRDPGGETAAAPCVSDILLTGFQQEGVERVRGVLDRRGGAILADSVGLGKTYMALALIEETLRARGDAIVVVPASVRSMWRRALHSLEDRGGGWRLVSHTSLVRGGLALREPGLDTPDEGSGGGPADRIVVVDEAHRFRNPRTMRYAALARLLGRSPYGGITRALLLTATPLNNRVEDLLHLIRLFARDDAFRDVGVPSLSDAFGVDSSRGGPAHDRVAAVVRTVVVRRTRDMVSARFDEPDSSLRFPRRALPRVVPYHDPALAHRVAELGSLDLAVYALSDDARASDGRAEPAGLILNNLLKRLDSSPAAFDASVLRLQELTRASLEAALAGRVMAPARGTGGTGDDGDPLQLTLVELVAIAAAPHMDMPALIASLRRDLEALDRLRPEAEPDAKLSALLALLDELGGERAIVFTEYRDTAAYLEQALLRRHRVGRVDGSGAWLGGRPAGRRSVVEAFAPLANGRGAVPERERVDVLIATDVLAEGVNLQDARHMISYDLPWNPVRLMQRIGRIDRLGSPHAEVASYLFVPGTGLDTILGLMRRLRQKLGHITTIVGGVQADELLAGLARGEQALERSDTPGCDVVETLRTLWVRERGEFTHDGPVASRTIAAVRVGSDDPAAALAWVALIRDAAGTALLELDREDTVRSPGARSVSALRQALMEGAVDAAGSDRGEAPMPERPLDLLRSHRAPAIAALRAPGPLPSHDGAALLARRIRRSVAEAGIALDRNALDRVDRALSRLAAPLEPGREEEVRSILAHDALDLESLLNRADLALSDVPGPSLDPRAASPEHPPDLQVLAALHIRLDPGLPRG